MSDEMLELLVAVVAVEDAVHRPCRYPGTNFRNNAAHLVSQWWLVGLRPPTGGGTTERRKRNERILSDCETAGLLIVNRPAGRTSHVKATDKGDEAVRAVCGLTGVRDCLTIVMPHLATRPAHRGGWVAETEMTHPRHEWGQPGFWPYEAVEIDLLPALRRQWVEANSDIRKHACYRLTDSGRAALANPPRLPAKPKKQPVAHWQTYQQLLVAEIDRLAAIDLFDQQGVSIPLSCSMGRSTPPRPHSDPDHNPRTHETARRTGSQTGPSWKAPAGV